MASPPGRPNPNKRAAASGKITVPDAASFVAARLRNTRFPAVRYRLTGAGLSPAGSRQLRLTHRNRKFESISLLRGVHCETDFRGLNPAGNLLPPIRTPCPKLRVCHFVSLSARRAAGGDVLAREDGQRQ